MVVAWRPTEPRPTSAYQDLWGYSLGETEPRLAVHEYPSYDFEVTPDLTNLDLRGILAQSRDGTGGSVK